MGVGVGVVAVAVRVRESHKIHLGVRSDGGGGGPVMGSYPKRGEGKNYTSDQSSIPPLY